MRVLLSITALFSVSAYAQPSGDANLETVAAPGPAHQTASFVWGDYDADGFRDAYVITPSGEGRLLHNLGDGTLEDVTTEAGLNGILAPRLVIWGDYDADGMVDLYVGTGLGARHLFHNQGEGVFEDTLEVAGIAHVGIDLHARWLDYDQDGLADLNVRTHAAEHLYHNLGDGVFERVELELPAGQGVAPGSATIVVEALGEMNAVEQGGSLQPAPEERTPDIAMGAAGASRAGSGPHAIGSTKAGSCGPMSGTWPGTGWASAIEDFANPGVAGVLKASTTPTLGMLYPMSSSLWVDSGGHVNVGDGSGSEVFRLDGATAKLRTLTSSGIVYLQPGTDWTTGSTAPLWITGMNGGPAHLVIEADGDVGIRTTAPAAELDVVGGAVRASRSTGSNQYLEMVNKDASGAWLRSMSFETFKKPLVIEALHDGSGSPAGSTDIAFRTGAASSPVEVMRCMESGKVGIGESNPTAKLDVTTDSSTEPWAIEAYATTPSPVGTAVPIGVYGSAASTTGRGVYGVAVSTIGFDAIGVQGQTESSVGIGVFGVATSTSGAAEGVRGYTYGAGTGVHGEYVGTSSYDAVGVKGISEPVADYGIGGRFEGGYTGVRGESDLAGSGSRYGGYFRAAGGEAINYGVYASVDDPQNDERARAVYASCDLSDGYAGYFSGDHHVTGTSTFGLGGSKADHPLDPGNKVLNHSFVGSPDLMNVYNGNVVLDKNGEAWVELPEWFEAYNRDFQYQLTAIGAAAPSLHVAQKIEHNAFQIAGGPPGLEVSWMVTGIRQDPLAKARRMPVEEMKRPEDRGLYLHPEAWGQPREQGIDYVKHELPRLRREAERAEREAARAKSGDRRGPSVIPLRKPKAARTPKPAAEMTPAPAENAPKSERKLVTEGK